MGQVPARVAGKTAFWAVLGPEFFFVRHPGRCRYTSSVHLRTGMCSMM